MRPIYDDTSEQYAEWLADRHEADQLPVGEWIWLADDDDCWDYHTSTRWYATEELVDCYALAMANRALYLDDLDRRLARMLREARAAGQKDAWMVGAIDGPTETPSERRERLLAEAMRRFEARLEDDRRLRRATFFQR